MRRSVRHGLLFATFALAAMSLFYANGSITAAPTKVAVSGLTAPMYLNAPSTFDPYDATTKTVRGDAYPVALICPGPVNFAAVAPLNFNVPCTPGSGSGFQGWIVAKEDAVRSYTNPSAPDFEAFAVLEFSGQIVLGDKIYFGGATLHQTVTGPLRQPAGVDCTENPAFVDPDNGDFVGCGAGNFSGNWEIVPNLGTGELKALRGNGTIVWEGGLSLPTYVGEMWFQYDTFLPVTSK